MKQQVRVILGSALAVAALCGCGQQGADKSLADQPHSVDEYYKDNALRSATIDACRASNEAENKVLRAKEACVNVWEAMKRHSNEGLDQAVQDDNARLKEAFEKKRKAAGH